MARAKKKNGPVEEAHDPDVFDKPLGRIAPGGDFVLCVGSQESMRAFFVDSHVLSASSAKFTDEILSDAKTSYITVLNERRPLVFLPDDSPQDFEVLLLKLHRVDRKDRYDTVDSWVRVAKLADKFKCEHLIWFEVDYFLRVNLTPWSLAEDAQNLWKGIVISHTVGNAEWFRAYSKNLIGLYNDSFSKLACAHVEQGFTFKLALALEEMRTETLQSLHDEKYSVAPGLCLACFNGVQTPGSDCQLCRRYEKTESERSAITDKMANLKEEKVNIFKARQQDKVATQSGPATPRPTGGRAKANVKPEGYGPAEALRIPDAKDTTPAPRGIQRKSKSKKAKRAEQAKLASQAEQASGGQQGA